MSAGKFSFGHFFLHGLLLSATSLMVFLWFMFYRRQKCWILVIANILNVVGVICLLMENIQGFMVLKSWLFIFFAIIHYGGLMLHVFMNIHCWNNQYSCGYGMMADCVDLLETRSSRWSCFSWRRRNRRRYEDSCNYNLRPSSSLWTNATRSVSGIFRYTTPLDLSSLNEENPVKVDVKNRVVSYRRNIFEDDSTFATSRFRQDAQEVLRSRQAQATTSQTVAEVHRPSEERYLDSATTALVRSVPLFGRPRLLQTESAPELCRTVSWEFSDSDFETSSI